MSKEQELLKAMCSAYHALQKLGWKEIIYCPKDGSVFSAIEPGSTGIHDCFYQGTWPDGHWYIVDEHDMYPSHPILWKPKNNPVLR